jgi:hypothetical protein
LSEPWRDTTYGTFTGHDKLTAMFRLFFRDGKNYVWDMQKIVAEPGSAMAEFFFSFLTTDRRNPDRSVKMIGVRVFDFTGPRISQFHEYFDVGPMLLQMGLAPERRSCAIGKSGLSKAEATPGGWDFILM